MKKGFSVFIQSDMEQTDIDISMRFISDFVNKTINHPNMNYFGMGNMGGYTTGLQRNRLGFLVHKNDGKSIFFRRISKNKRHFACVYADTMKVYNDKYLFAAHQSYRPLQDNGNINLNMCQCCDHLGSIKVAWRNKPTFEQVCTHGDLDN